MVYVTEKKAGVSRRTLLTAAALTCAGCGTSTGASSSKVEKPQLTVATVQALTNMGLYLAQQHGFFAAEGLQVKIAPVVSSTTAVANQLHGGVDVTAGAYASYILAQAKSSGAISWRILAPGSVSQPHSQEVLVASGSPIKTVADLHGKTVAANILGNVGSLLIDSMLSAYSMPPSSVKQVAMPFPEMAPALKKGTIDAAWFDEPFLSQAKSSIGAQSLYDTGTGATASLPISGYLVTRDWAKQNPKTAAAFGRAIARGQALADTSRAASQSAITKFLKVNPALTSVVTLDSYPDTLDPVPIQRVADVMHQFGLLQKPFDVRQMTS
jgi:NitT/TauT family transport system substrate-binding protein